MNPRPPLPIFFLLVIACWLPAGAAASTQLSWYGDGVQLGGSGWWDTTSPYWSTNGTTFKAWNNSNNDGATFDYGSAGPGEVFVAAPITAGNLTFNDTGFQLAPYGTVTLTLAGTPTVSVASGATANISVPLAGSADVTLSGGGELVLAASNTSSGAMTLSATALQLANANALPAGNLLIDGGLVELRAGNFSRDLGSGTGQVRFTSNGGGFAAVRANYAVNLGGQSATVIWGSASFLPNNGSTSATLLLGSPLADSTIDFQNPINLGSATRTVQVNMGSSSVAGAVDAKLSGVLSGSGGLIVTGDGTLALTASNLYSGGTTVSGGILSVQNGAALGSGGVTLDGGTLRVATSTAVSNSVSLSADSGIDVTGVTAATLGNLAIGGNTLYVTSGGTAAYGLTLGRGALNGNPTFDVADNGSGSATLTLGALDDGGTARTLTKAGNGALTLAAAATSLVQGTTVNVAGGTLQSNNAAALGAFARVTVSSGALFKLGVSQQISALAGSGNVALGGNTLTVGNSDNQSCTFSGVLSGSGGALVKQGAGTLTLSGDNNYTGGTTVDDGLLVISNSLALPSRSALSIGPDGSLILGAPLPGMHALGDCPNFRLSENGTVPLSGGAAGTPTHAVPEPASLALLAAAVSCGFAVALEQRRRKLTRSNSLLSPPGATK